MRIEKFGHSCLLVAEDGVRVLLDPGTYSRGFDVLTGLAAVLLTHQHQDHVDLSRLPGLLAANPRARLVVDEGTAAIMARSGGGYDPEVVHAGDELEIAGMPVRALGHEHAVVHPDVPIVPNVGYLIAGRLLHPGDALTVPDQAVDVLGLPTGAPWLKASEAVDYLRAVRPRVAVPIHEGVLAVPQLYYGLFTALAPAGSQVRVLDGGEALDV